MAGSTPSSVRDHEAATAGAASVLRAGTGTFASHVYPERRLRRTSPSWSQPPKARSGDLSLGRVRERRRATRSRRRTITHHHSARSRQPSPGPEQRPAPFAAALRSASVRSTRQDPNPVLCTGKRAPVGQDGRPAVCHRSGCGSFVGGATSRPGCRGCSSRRVRTLITAFVARLLTHAARYYRGQAELQTAYFTVAPARFGTALHHFRIAFLAPGRRHLRSSSCPATAQDATAHLRGSGPHQGLPGVPVLDPGGRPAKCAFCRHTSLPSPHRG